MQLRCWFFWVLLVAGWFVLVLTFEWSLYSSKDKVHLSNGGKRSKLITAARIDCKLHICKKAFNNTLSKEAWFFLFYLISHTNKVQFIIQFCNYIIKGSRTHDWIMLISKNQLTEIKLFILILPHRRRNPLPCLCTPWATVPLFSTALQWWMTWLRMY